MNYRILRMFYFIVEKSDVDDLFELYTSMPLDEENPGEYFYDKRKFNEGLPADDWRLTSVAHIPLAVSVPQLIKKVCLVNNRQGISDLLFSKYVHLFTSLIIGQDLWHVWV